MMAALKILVRLILISVSFWWWCLWTVFSQSSWIFPGCWHGNTSDQILNICGVACYKTVSLTYTLSFSRLLPTQPQRDKGVLPCHIQRGGACVWSLLLCTRGDPAPHCPALPSPWQEGVGLPPYCLSLTFRVWPYYCLKSVTPDSPLGLFCNHLGRKPEGRLHIVLVGGNIGSLWPRTPWERAPHCLLEGMKVPAPHLAFSDTTLARGSRRYTLFLPGGVPVYTPTCPVPMGWGDSKARLFASSCLAGIEYYLKVFTC